MKEQLYAGLPPDVWAPPPPYLCGGAQTACRGNAFRLLLPATSFFQSLPKAGDHASALGRPDTTATLLLTPHRSARRSRVTLTHVFANLRVFIFAVSFFLYTVNICTLFSRCFAHYILFILEYKHLTCFSCKFLGLVFSLFVAASFRLQANQISQTRSLRRTVRTVICKWSDSPTYLHGMLW